jgi:DNA-binding protein WhiA
MSFSSEVKTELCRKLKSDSGCCAKAAVYGILLYGNRFAADGVRVITEHEAFAETLPALMLDAFGLEFDECAQPGKQGKFAFALTAPAKIQVLFDAFGGEPMRELSLHLNRAVLDCSDCAAAFARGAFLAGGAVTDPAKRYHLELLTGHYFVDREVMALLRESGLNPKSIVRGGNHMLYLKRSTEIEDALTLMGAPLSAMAVMNAKLEKELRGSVSRRVNCDSANAGKIANAAVAQQMAIRRLSSSGKLSTLAPALQEAAGLRNKYPESSLAELAAIAGVSKSGLAHRFRRIVEYDGN